MIKKIVHAICMRFRAYLAVIHISWLSRTAFAGSLLANGLLVGLFVWIMKQLYTATYLSAGTDLIGGLSLTAVVWLVVLVQSFERATWPNPISMIDDEIKLGTISYQLQRPIHYILYQYFAFWGRILSTLIGNLMFGGLAALLLVGPVAVTCDSLVGGLVAIILGYTLDFLIFFIFGITGFWVEEVKPFTWLYSKTKLIFGGAILPIAFFPKAIQNIALLLPFSNLYYTASQIIVQYDSVILCRCLLVQCFWIIIFSFFAYYLFNKGVRHVTINGG